MAQEVPGGGTQGCTHDVTPVVAAHHEQVGAAHLLEQLGGRVGTRGGDPAQRDTAQRIANANKSRAKRVQRDLDAIRSSMFWRVTAPLRSVRRWLRRR